jgi:hypothetical protein
VLFPILSGANLAKPEIRFKKHDPTIAQQPSRW